MIGKITGITQDYMNGGISVTLSVKGCTVQELKALSQMDLLDIDIKKHREHRSKDANAYFHVLVGKIADAMQPPISKAYAKNILIGKYGQPELVDGQPVHIKTELDVEKMLEQENLHCFPCGGKTENGKALYFYRIYRGSHTYNTKEMSILIDGTVEEAKQIGIETLPPAELERMVQAWQK